MELTLVIREGEDAGRQVTLAGKTSVTVGTSPASDVIVKNDPLMDGQHFRIDQMTSGRLWIQDLMSKSGTTVNGGRIQRTQLKIGDIVRAGHLVMEVLAGADATLPAPSTADADSSSSGEMSWSEQSSGAGADSEMDDPILRASLRGHGFSLGTELGSGTFGRVYRGVRDADAMDVAIKVFEGTPVDSPERMKLFLREMDIHQKLDHPNIVRFFEHGANEPYSAWFAMEYVDGVTLSQWVRTTKELMPVTTACSIVRQVLSALDYAHRLPAPLGPIVHRDLKPSNIMVDQTTKSPVIKVCDFGLAKNFERAGFSSITMTGQSRGNIEYMSPDQAMDSKYSGPEVDVYAVGGILHFCLTGSSLYDVRPGASASEILNAKMAQRTARLRQFREDVPEVVQSLIDRAIARDETRQFRTAGQMLRSIEEVIRRIGPQSNDV
ncbi:MAG: protein kinase [Planctomycetales bacterium]|nr:protein kinase [Planctomycetales bacterium]